MTYDLFPIGRSKKFNLLPVLQQIKKVNAYFIE